MERPKPDSAAPGSLTLRISARLAALLLLVACGTEAPRSDPPPPPVRVHVVRLETVSPTVRVTAPVLAERRATLRVEAAGRVLAVPLRSGAVVREGELILRLSRPRSRTMVSEAQARLQQSRAALRQLTRAREEVESLAADNASAPNQLEEARDRETVAAARVAEAEASLRAARDGVNENVLRAPFDGVLADFRVREGEYVAPGAEVGTLVDPSGLEANLFLDPVEAADVSVGGRVEVRARPRPDLELDARIEHVGDVLDARSGRLPVRVSIEDPDRTLRAGSVAEFDVVVGAPREIARLPANAVSRRMGQTRVLVVEGELAALRDVAVGQSRDGQVEILEGLRAGDRVVIEGAERVVPGEPVRVVEDAPPAGEAS